LLSSLFYWPQYFWCAHNTMHKQKQKNPLAINTQKRGFITGRGLFLFPLAMHCTSAIFVCCFSHVYFREQVIVLIYNATFRSVCSLPFLLAHTSFFSLLDKERKKAQTNVGYKNTQSLESHILPPPILTMYTQNKAHRIAKERNMPQVINAWEVIWSAQQNHPSHTRCIFFFCPNK
jgi:hypothetical protein